MTDYTQIQNNILEALALSNLSASEFRVILVFLRKINGYHKTSDQISYSQLMELTGLSRQGIANALSQLQLVKIIRLVKKGTSKRASNEWVIEQDINKWQLVKRVRLVKFPTPTSQVLSKKLVNTSRHTKENTKENIQKKEKHTRDWFIKNKEKIQDKVSELYIDKDVSKAIESFVNKTGAKNYGYTDYYLAFCNWVREDKFNEFTKQSRGVAPKFKFSDLQ